MGAVPAASHRRRRRGRRWLIALLVLVVLLVAADRVGAAVAEHEAATTLQSSQHLASRPSVQIAGFPFLTQLISGTFDNVTITATGVTVGDTDRTLRLGTVTVHLHDVSVARNLSSVRAGSATADAVVSYADLSHTLGVPVSYAGPTSDGAGRIRAAASAAVDGRTVAGAVAAEVRASSAGGLEFVDPTVAVDGQDAPPAVSEALAGVLGRPVALSRLPFGVSVLGVHADAGGVTIRLAGQNLSFHKG
jgi:hypothetical protein